jgi:hypothetical protein
VARGHHKLESLLDMSENCQKDYDRRMRNAYAMSNYAEAKETLQRIFRQPERINLSAAWSLRKGWKKHLWCVVWV